ncbi:ABC transporter permease [Aneurinibacillus aneurinilyticus]|jgi:ABC-2 type transport system permease protein|uniref:ABC transporter permease subunit n=2 Tax=Aneurinibacillus aneurinilyticus TaxID=1391 RepID=A0A848CW04_ANEAE|nr:ABC transporter permease subunit [Aneurinibacillus aneurinilyticus]ERI08074.1 ABC-2 type transporter [Aneurinibacillus aneurinilyticus ATCC 12856]MCI1693178.1 ABC transporter permease [Aneurinibacillus aneurinilyticus]MED0671233.1 ABC transporter permease subunit [Aneurinibacillus aneurinilyticus]MED0707586.1 ABC transporter permease subunit [Aneurinibacillus aneurinilyticus]MED0725516.1 ABC transporter permease subunit [Aneurinibacillus aneurinilyticus]
MRFLALVQNEIMKINSKKQSIFFLYFCLVFIIGIGIANRSLPDLYAAREYLKFTYNLAPFLMIFVTLFAIVLGAQSITDEFKDGTIKQLLLRPVSRRTILLSKYVANLIVIIGTVLVLWAASVLIDVLLFGMVRSGELTFGIVCKTYLYGLPDSIFMMTLSFFIATVFKSSPLSITVSFFLYIAGNMLSSLLPEKWGAKYIIFNNLNLKVYDPNLLINGGIEPPFSGMSFGFSVAMMIVYIAGLLLIQIAVFEKREVY